MSKLSFVGSLTGVLLLVSSAFAASPASQADNTVTACGVSGIPLNLVFEVYDFKEPVAVFVKATWDDTRVVDVAQCALPSVAGHRTTAVVSTLRNGAKSLALVNQ